MYEQESLDNSAEINFTADVTRKICHQLERRLYPAPNGSITDPFIRQQENSETLL